MVRRAAVAVLFVPFATGSALAACPFNQVGNHSAIIAATNADSSCTTPGPCDWVSQWDNTNGTAWLHGTGPNCSGEISSSSTVPQYTSDDFVISGPAGPVSFQAFLHVVGSGTIACRTVIDPVTFKPVQSCAQATVGAKLTDGTLTATAPDAASLNTNLQLNLTQSVGEQFHLDRTLNIHVACRNSATMYSEFSIVLPSGYSVTSCYGYSASSPVPALRASWGKVKLLYR